MFKKILLFSALCIGMISNAQNIVSGEYFFDTYKNLGQGTSFSIVPDNIVNKTLSISTNNLSSGMHNLFVRVKDANDSWSLVENKLFYIMPSLSNYGNLTACEWFIDTDPGLGNGTVTNFSAPTTTIAMPLSINTTNLSSGLHRLYIRVKDDSNIWSIVECKLFYIMPAATAQPNLTSGEWFVDTDPGVGNGTVISFAEGAIINKTFDISNASFTVGTHKLFVRVKNSDGVWSLYDAKEFSVTPSSPPPPPTASAQSLCKFSTVANLVATGSNLKWYSVATGGNALATTTALTTKTYYVSQSAGAFESTRTSVPVTIVALPTTPGTITGIITQAALVGTSTTATYSITAVSGASSYFWTTPTGVNIVSAQGTTSVDVNFQNVSSGAGTIGSLMVQSVNDTGCKSVAKSLSLTKALPTAPSTPKLTDGVTTTAITNISKYMGTITVLKLTCGSVATATSYEWELPVGVNRTDGIGTNSLVPYIYVNFLGVTNTNTSSYISTKGVLTHVLRIGVKSKNGTGLSTTANAALVNPTTTSTAKLLTLTAIRPASPANLKMYDLDSVTPTTAITDISKYIGNSRELTLIAAASVLARAYSWELPTGVNVVTGTDTTSDSIKVNFLNVPHESTAISLYIGVKAVNGIDSSVKVNAATLVPSTTSTATLLKVTATAPLAAGTVIGDTAICSSIATNVIYTISSVAKNANIYNITAPVGCTVTYDSITSESNLKTIPAIAGVSFTVNYPGGFTSTTLYPKTIVIQSENGFGVNVTSKTIKLTSNGVCSTRLDSSTKGTPAEATLAQVYPNPNFGKLTIELSVATASNVSMTISTLTGSVLSSKNIVLTAGKNIINSTISSLTNGVYIITFTNTTTGEVITKKIVKQ